MAILSLPYLQTEIDEKDLFLIIAGFSYQGKYININIYINFCNNITKRINDNDHNNDNIYIYIYS